MGNPYKKNLISSNNGIILKTYDHASKLYISDKLARAPKLGFLYYINFTVNTTAFSSKAWLDNFGLRDVALLVKKIDLPKFKIATETINQYNRKTNIQTKITYEPISVEFHDDNSNITNGLWQNYYSYYYADTNYGDSSTAYTDNKFGQDYVNYGLANQQDVPLFDNIEIFVLHQGNFTKIKLINPLITQWDHDSLDQSDGAKIMHSRMTLAYENVVYDQGVIANDEDASAFELTFYDHQQGSITSGNGAAIGTTPAFRIPPMKQAVQKLFNINNTGRQQAKIAALQQGLYNGPVVGNPIPLVPSSPVGVNIPVIPEIPSIPALPIRLN